MYTKYVCVSIGAKIFHFKCVPFQIAASSEWKTRKPLRQNWSEPAPITSTRYMVTQLRGL